MNRRSLVATIVFTSISFAPVGTHVVADEPPLAGYSAESSRAERQWEEKMRAIPEPDKIRGYIERLAARPHHVGSPYDKDNAEWLLARFKEFGLDAHIENFDVLMPTPKERVVELVDGGPKFTAKLQEPVLKVDPTSGQTAEQLHTYNSYSIDGDVTAPLVYVNFGVPADYEQLERMGISVKGAIVIARYYGSWRGINPKVAAEHGAIGCLIFSDPHEDGYTQGDVYPEGPYRPKDGVQRGVVNIFGRVTTLSGHIAQTFEDTVQADIPAELLAKSAENSQVYWKAVPLRSGRYRVDIVVKDVNGDRVGTWSKGVQVPDYSDDRLDASSLIVADLVEPVAAKNVGTGMFVIGATKVRPRVPPADGKPIVFKRNQKMNFWMQVYNLGVDDKTHKASATVEYNVVNATTNKPVIHSIESTDQMGNVGDQMTLQKTLSAANLDPGVYRIQIKVNDNISKQTLDPSATFAVE